MSHPNQQNQFLCDTNGSIMVMAALRYSLGRHTYVPGAVIDWISLHWNSLDSNTKRVIVRDVFEYLYRDYSFRNDAQFMDIAGDYDNKEWNKFGIDKYWKLEYTDRKNVDQELNSNKDRAVWFAEKLYGTQPSERLHMAQATESKSDASVRDQTAQSPIQLPEAIRRDRVVEVGDADLKRRLEHDNAKYSKLEKRRPRFCCKRRLAACFNGRSENTQDQERRNMSDDNTHGDAEPSPASAGSGAANYGKHAGIVFRGLLERLK